ARRRTAEIDSLSAAEMSAPAVITCAGAGMCASRPNQRRSSSTSATMKRPSFLTGIPLSLAHRCAIAAPTPRYEPIACQPFSVWGGCSRLAALFFVLCMATDCTRRQGGVLAATAQHLPVHWVLVFQFQNKE